MPTTRVFPGELQDLDYVDPNDSIESAERLDCGLYAEGYHARAILCRAAGDAKTAAGFQFLVGLCTIGESFDTPQHPFSPLWQSPTGRTLLPADLTPQDVVAVEVLAAKSKNPALTARLLDIIWETKHDAAACIAAAAAYLATAKALDNDKDWILAIQKFARSLHLASRLGYEKPLYRSVVAAIEDAVNDRTIDPQSFRALRLMRVVLRARTSDPARLATLSAQIASECESVDALDCAKAYREIESEWRRHTGDPAGAKAAALAAAEIAVKLALRRVETGRKSALAAAGLLVDAIEMLRRAGAARERVEELRRRLLELQAESLQELQTTSFQVDISQEVKAARAHVQGRSFASAVLRLAMGIRPVSVTDLKREVEAAIQNHPLSHMIDAAVMDEKGRTIAHEKGVFGKLGSESAILEAKMFTHVTRFQWGPRVSTFIEPARVQILNEHQPTLDQVAEIIHNNPFVPPGHETIFIRGLHAGLHGDFMVSSHLLVPQVENSLRYVLESRGVDVSNLQSDKTQPVRILGALLGMPAASTALGEDLTFSFRGHLIEKLGFDFRNQVAHGFVDDDSSFGSAAISTWWLILHTCVFFTLTGGADSGRPLR